MPLPNSKQIADVLDAISDPKKRANRKADYLYQFFSDGSISGHYTYVFGVYTITVTNAERIGAVIWFTLSATKGRQSVDVGDGRFGFVNPPLMVHDKTFREEIDALTGEMVTILNSKIDVLAAFENMVGEAVSEYVTRHG